MTDTALSVRQNYVPPRRSGADLGSRIISGTAWAIAGTAAGAVVQFISSIVYARLLTPLDFGLMAWANVIAQFVFLFTNFGFNVSIVQRESLGREELSTIWWSNVIVDGLAATLCFVIAFVSRHLSASPDVPPLLMLMALQFGITAVGAVNEALMLRQFMFREMAINSFVGNLSGFLAAVLLLRLTGLGVYALVVGGIIGTVVSTVNRFLFVPWLPSRTFSWVECRRQLAFGSSLMGAMLIGYANGNIDKTTIGTMLDKRQLGYFEYASAIPAQIVSQLGTLLNRALFPALATLQSNVLDFRRVLLRYIRMISLLAFPLLVGLALVADLFVSVAYGDKWAEVVAPMRAVCITGLFALVAGSLIMVCNALGRPNLALKTSITAFPVNAALTVAAVKLAGLLGAAVSRAFVPALTVGLLWRSLGQLIPLSAWDLFSAVSPALTGCAGMAVLLMSVDFLGMASSLGPVQLLGLKVVLGAVTYFFIVWAGWRTEVDAVLDIFRRLTKTRHAA